MDLSKQIEYRKVSGDENTIVQQFFSNRNEIAYPNKTITQNFEIPMFLTSGGTYDYYGQDPSSVFTNLNNPFIRYYFTANTFSLSGDTSIVYRIYRLDYDTYKKYEPDFTKINTQQQSTNHQQIQEETVIVNGQKTVTTRITNTINTATTENSVKVDLSTKDDIKNLLENPFYQIEVPSSDFTIPYYDLIFNQYVKSSGTTSDNYSTKLFTNKSQYFVKPIFKFSFPVSNTYVARYSIIESNAPLEINDPLLDPMTLYPSYFNNGKIYENTAYNYPNESFNLVENPVFSSTTYIDSFPDSIISASTFSGFSVGGSFFTYFDVPNKPKLEEPMINGQLDTFSPKFYFSNVVDGDYFLVEIDYSTGFTEQKVVYEIEKSFITDTNIQEASVSVKADATNFVYRIGNVKKLDNIFGVRQKIVTYSDTYSATTQTQSANIFVYTQSDSPYTTVTAPYVTPPSMTITTPGNYVLSGLVSGSIVSAATIYLTMPDTTIVSATTTSAGNYYFSGLTFGNYIVTTNYRGYKTNETGFLLSSNKKFDYVLEILWSNSYETFNIKSNDIIL